MLAVIVPYRDRQDHLRKFLPRMNSYLPSAKIVVVEQCDQKKFNRGKLLNIGFLKTDSTHYCMHDVDMLPTNVNYTELNGIFQKVKSDIQKVDFFGGVTIFDLNSFYLMGGYHNDYFHRAEDNEARFQLKRLNIPVHNAFGSFEMLEHTRSGPEFIPELWQRAQLPRTVNMLDTCDYQLLGIENFDTHTHIRVLL